MKKYLTHFLMLICVGFAFSASAADLINVAGQPGLGSLQAPVQVVAFLEPKCPDSKQYHNSSFAQLESEFIHTNQVHYTVITASFLPHSMPAAMGLLCVYNQDPSPPHADQFFKFLSYIYKNQPPEKDNWATVENVLKFAGSASNGIDVGQLKKCLEDKHYQAQVEKNTAYGNQLMGHISTPTLYVDGVKIENTDESVDYAILKKAIEKALEEKKVAK